MLIEGVSLKCYLVYIAACKSLSCHQSLEILHKWYQWILERNLLLLLIQMQFTTGKVKEYPTMHDFGIPRLIQSVIDIRFWLSISGYPHIKLQCGNVVGIQDYGCFSTMISVRLFLWVEKSKVASIEKIFVYIK